MASPWQCLGAWISNLPNVQIEQLDDFKRVGGKWVAVNIYNDDVNAAPNKQALTSFKAFCGARGISVWGWLNGHGEEPVSQAKEMAGVLSDLNLVGGILDLEAEYQYPGGDANKMPILVSELRKYTKKPLGVTTNSMTNACIWNGRTLSPPQSFYDLGIRVVPQWYTAYYDKDGNSKPQYQMKWLKENGHLDGNFRDNNATRTGYRGLPLSYVHGVIEVTGLEGSSLEREIQDVLACKQYGYTTGVSIYLLENVKDDNDWSLLQAQRGKLYLV